jgi:hypothetical protein
MKSFIDRIFKKRKQDAEEFEEPVKTEDKTIETVVKAVSKEVKQKEVFTKPGHYFADCNCVKCVRWRNQN